MSTEKIHSFQPILSDAPKVLILGTMPSVKSLEQSFYYGHPRNAFWPLLFDLLNQPFSDQRSDREALIRNHHLALWDVLEGCIREGSLDSAIREEIPNPLPEFMAMHSSLRLVVFNGQPAFRFYKRHFGQPQHLDHLVLPSTSPAHAAKSFEQKKAAWQALLPYLQ